MQNVGKPVIFGNNSEFLDKEKIIQCLDWLNEELKKKDVVGELSIVGGAVMCLCYN